MKEKQFSSPTVMGSSSLLTVFAVLCLVVFAILSVSTVQSQRSLSKASAKAVENYYNADTQAEIILAEIRTGKSPEEVQRKDGIYYYSCPVSDTQSLEVEVRLDNEGNYEIIRWQAVSTALWELDTSIDVWSGE